MPEALDALSAIVGAFTTAGSSPDIDELFAAAAELVRGNGSVH